MSGMADLVWKTQPWKKPGVNVYKIKAWSSAIADISKENDAFNRACAQFCKLSHVSMNNVLEVWVVEYDETSNVLQRYDRKREAFREFGKPVKELFVFHGTVRKTLSTSHLPMLHSDHSHIPPSSSFLLPPPFRVLRRMCRISLLGATKWAA